MPARRSLFFTCTLCLFIWANCSVEKEAGPDGTPPAAIDDLAWEYYADSTVLLTWTAPGDDGREGSVSFYALYESNSAEPDTLPIDFAWWDNASVSEFELTEPAAGGGVESLRVGGLIPGYEHRMGMLAGDEVPNWTDSSNVIEFIMPSDETAPAPIADLSVAAPTDTSLTLSWTATGNDSATGLAKRYDIRYSQTAFTADDWDLLDPDVLIPVSANLLPVPQIAGAAETYLLRGLKENQTYYLALTAWDANGPSTVSNIVTGATLSDELPPAAVIDLTAYATTSTSLILNWTATGDDGASGRASRYRVYYDDASFTLSQIDSVDTADPPQRPLTAGSRERYLLTGMDPDSTYYVGLRTFDDAEQGSDLSNLVTVTLPLVNDEINPSRIADLAGFAYSASSITLKWTAPGDDGLTGQANLYNIYFARSALASGTEVWAEALTLPDPPAPSIGGSYQEFTIEGLEKNTTYFIAIKAADEAFNWGAVSDCIQVKTPLVSDTIPPAALSDLAIVAAGETAITISWTVTGNDSLTGTCSVYDIRYSTDVISNDNWRDLPQVAVPPAPTALGATQTFTIGELTPETTYHIAVKAGDLIPNWSDISPVVNATTGSISAPYSVVTLAMPAGQFAMGADDSQNCGSDVHLVTLSQPFAIGLLEVTNQQYLDMLQWAHDEGYIAASANTVLDRLDGASLDGASIELIDLDDDDCEIAFDSETGLFSTRVATTDDAVGAYPGSYDPANHPVKEVSWYGAVAWCDWLSIRAGLPRAYDHSTWRCNDGDPYGASGYRLPTDAEWEYVTQYGAVRTYPWGEAAPDCGLANLAGCVGWTVGVGAYTGYPDIGGAALFDLAGNVREWCHDWFVCDLGTEPVSDPVGTEPEGDERVCRGGAWLDIDSRCATRLPVPPEYTGNLVGFRVCLSEIHR